jgi:archaemetzincin
MISNSLSYLALCMVFFMIGWFSAGADDSLTTLRNFIDKLRPLHTKLGEPKPGDWLSIHNEPGQTFREYIGSNPVLPTSNRRTIYVQPLGVFSPTQYKIIMLTTDFMGRYFSLPVKVKENLPLSIIPPEARRVHPTLGDKQILTFYVLNKVLRPRLPKDAVTYIAFTTSDLWPGRGWNFVFGQATLRDRVGVWSIYRNGDPDAGPAAFRLCLLRTMKTATHEMGHMFSMFHCTAYQCNMCGSNHRKESDSRPIACCPECVAKIWWATKSDSIDRYRKLADFCKEHGFRSEETFYEKSIRALGGK